MATLSVDLAYKDYADIGVVTVARHSRRVVAKEVRLSHLGLHGRPALEPLAEVLDRIAREVHAAWILIDGPQGWKGPETGELHSRKCERELATQGKTGLPGITKPRSYLPFITFSINLFSALEARGWPRLRDTAVPSPNPRAAIETFPTAAWRALGLPPLPGKARARLTDISERLDDLRSMFPLDAPVGPTHDELQALVAGLAGVAFDGGNAQGYRLAGVSPYAIEGWWREGYIIIPTRHAAA